MPVREARKTTMQLSPVLRFRLDRLDDARGNAADDGQRGHIARDDGTGSHHGAVADGHARKHRGVRAMGDLTREASFGLAYNGAIFAREGLGYLLAFDHIVDTGPGSDLVFRPLEPPLHTDLYFTWKRGRPLTPIAERFCRQVREAFGS